MKDNRGFPLSFQELMQQFVVLDGLHSGFSLHCDLEIRAEISLFDMDFSL